MNDIVLTALSILLGVVVPMIVYARVLYGVAPYGRTVVASASWTLCLGIILARRMQTAGFDVSAAIILVVMLLMAMKTYVFRFHLIPEEWRTRLASRQEGKPS